jgi:hypothetical protein
MELRRITYSPAALIPPGAENGHTGSQCSEASVFHAGEVHQNSLGGGKQQRSCFGESGKNLGELGKRAKGRQTTLSFWG